jgi:hypothetical protein
MKAEHGSRYPIRNLSRDLFPVYFGLFSCLAADHIGRAQILRSGTKAVKDSVANIDSDSSR